VFTATNLKKLNGIPQHMWKMVSVLNFHVPNKLQLSIFAENEAHTHNASQDRHSGRGLVLGVPFQPVPKYFGNWRETYPNFRGVDSFEPIPLLHERHILPERLAGDSVRPKGVHSPTNELPVRWVQKEEGLIVLGRNASAYVKEIVNTCIWKKMME